ncbi:DUF4097 domain-containing protein [Salinimonas sp. HHU 13199]|uniref:DUF4097 domain-containing protein n=1 Tax=Salinimonas profundi TaxID=2729140 RepID=A0ABR8LPC5_9ALTE|nr:DUF4097 family beta strand repeat-containing protein [Salinimonas profundi]MBD3585804.1 DUF4097 domain-containing protein [Salinimonas profundi]
MLKRLSFCTALGLSLLSTQVLAEKITKSFTVSPDGTLTLRTDAGAIEITTHSANTIDVDVDIDQRNDGDFTVEFEQDDDGVTIDGEREGQWYGGSLRVRYAITLPEQYNIDVDTAGGAISVEALTGDVEARTSGGRITISDVTGDIDIKTSGGALDITNVKGNIDGHTSGGGIDLKLTEQPEEDVSLHTSGGSINAMFPETVKIDLEANTSGGRVKSEWPVQGSVSKREIEGKINGGGPQVDLKTSGGSIHVEKI